ncbi:GntR family transcriptional regulator [Hydrogenophaga crassostreae]|uniref:GntR family transcriptional regulator n=1 Tax=Hydrogenophaga crassostreae TaxID=1763535 RepID=A0A162SU67_9BURK|nr:FadR/GntR family transcriptional regulator [Hydrogenophaga crassostreae]AOW12492.1 GntR family transcriptional regulator [Hydrogenophaga crassostreae]OAD40357.1 GntR family transcriptional regulator [Hydrogenophaga crassostreae]
MPFQPIEPRRLYRQIADQLRQLIQSGEFAVGSRLPPERDLATKMGVSRPSVREALIALEVEGLIEVRMGSGIVVIGREGVRLLDNAHGPLEIIRARQLIESELAALAARSTDAALVPDLLETLSDMEADIAASTLPIRGDRAFHIRIAQASDNSALQAVITQLFDERYGQLFTTLGSHFERENTWKSALEEHRVVVKAIAAKDPEMARAAMSGHLAQSHERFSAGWSSASDTDTQRSHK